MNKERLLQLANAIENEMIYLYNKKVSFDIDKWFTFNECGTFACINKEKTF